MGSLSEPYLGYIFKLEHIPGSWYPTHWTPLEHRVSGHEPQVLMASTYHRCLWQVIRQIPVRQMRFIKLAWKPYEYHPVAYKAKLWGTGPLIYYYSPELPFPVHLNPRYLLSNPWHSRLAMQDWLPHVHEGLTVDVELDPLSLAESEI